MSGDDAMSLEAAVEQALNKLYVTDSLTARKFEQRDFENLRAYLCEHIGAALEAMHDARWNEMQSELTRLRARAAQSDGDMARELRLCRNLVKRLLYELGHEESSYVVEQEGIMKFDGVTLDFQKDGTTISVRTLEENP